MRVLNKYKTEEVGTYIGRGSPLGNPFAIGKHGNRIEVVYMYEQYLKYQILVEDPDIMTALKNLRQDDALVCYCAPKLCHGAVIARLYDDLVGGGMLEFRNEHALLGLATNGVDHINLAIPAGSELSKNVCDIVAMTLHKCKHSVDKEDYFTKLKEELRYHLEGNVELLELLSKTSMSFRYYTRNSRSTLDGLILDCWFSYNMNDVLTSLLDKERLIITGNKDTCTYEDIRTLYINSGMRAGVIILGLNSKIDAHLEVLANTFNIRTVRCYPHWNMLYEKVDPNRDKDIIDYSTALLALLDGNDRVVRDLINKCINAERKIVVRKT